jgi:hypothetical protein
MINWLAKRRARKLLESKGICPVHGIQRKIMRNPYPLAWSYFDCPQCDKEQAEKVLAEVKKAVDILGLTLTTAGKVIDKWREAAQILSVAIDEVKKNEPEAE